MELMLPLFGLADEKSLLREKRLADNGSFWGRGSLKELLKRREA